VPIPASTGAPPDPVAEPPAPDDAPPAPPALDPEPVAPPALEDVPDPVVPAVPLVVPVPDVPLALDDVEPDDPTPLVPLPELSSEPQAHAAATRMPRAQGRARGEKEKDRMTRTSMAWPP
jgi:protein TonB